MKILLATTNPGKIKEFSAIFADLPIEFELQSQYGIAAADETGLSFVENAILKARHAAKHTGMCAIADDSGLCVDYLHGAPGIYSARYAGENANDASNLQKLLNDLKGVPTEKRQASFYCAIAFVRHADDPTPLIAQGRWHGVITQTAQGENGFGYDPIFFVPQENCTSAQLPSAVKNDLSHRGQALQAFWRAFSDVYSYEFAKGQS